MSNLFDNDDVKWTKVICNSQASYYNIDFFQQLLDLNIVPYPGGQRNRTLSERPKIDFQDQLSLNNAHPGKPHV